MRIGMRVQLHAATDEWMRGDRFGTVEGFGRLRDYVEAGTRNVVKARPVRVRLDRSGRVRRFHPNNVFPLD